MGASVRVKDTDLADPRFRALGHLIRSDEDGALGKVVRVRMYCLVNETSVVSEALLVSITGKRNFGPCLVEVGLGEKVEGGVRIEGIMDWIERRQERRRSGAAGAISRWQRKLSYSSAIANHGSAMAQLPLAIAQPSAAPSPPSLPPSSPSIPPSSPALVSSSSPSDASHLRAASRRGGVQGELWDFFAQSFERVYGEPPTRRQEWFVQFAALVKQHGIERCKAHVTEAHAATWWTKGRIDPGVFVQHFDKFGPRNEPAASLSPPAPPPSMEPPQSPEERAAINAKMAEIVRKHRRRAEGPAPSTRVEAETARPPDVPITDDATDHGQGSFNGGAPDASGAKGDLRT